jgi:hypothetical protein
MISNLLDDLLPIQMLLMVNMNCTVGKNLTGPLTYTRVYPKVSGLAAWSENCKWYSSLPQGADVSLFCESV